MLKSRKEIIFFLAPGILIYTVFMFVPLIASLPISFFEWTGIGEKRFIGIANYVKLFTTEPFNKRLLNAFKNNVVWFIITVVAQNAYAVFIAVLLTSQIKFRRFFRVLFFAPTTLSVVIIGFAFTLIFNPRWGMMNSIVELLNIVPLINFPWLGSEVTALPILALVNSWQYFGIPLILLIASIESIPAELEEAAIIDGCNSLKRFRYVTFPLLLPVLGLITILTFVGDFSGFELVFSMTGTMGTPNYSTDIFGTFFYRTAFGSYGGAAQDMGLASAIAAVMTFVIGIGALIWIVYDNKVKNIR